MTVIHTSNIYTLFDLIKILSSAHLRPYSSIVIRISIGCRDVAWNLRTVPSYQH